MSARIAAAALLLSTTYALTPNQYPSERSDIQGAFPQDGSAIFIAANQAPNVSQTVRFKHFSYDEGTVDNSGVAWQDWSWTVSVSDVFLLNASTSIPSAHVAYTTYELSWPEAGDLNAAIRAETNVTTNSYGQSCAYVFGADLPLNVSDAWNASSSDCTSALGQECVNVLLSQMSSNDNDRRCSTGSFNLLDPRLETACAGSFFANGGVINSVEPLPFGNASALAANTTSLGKGDVFHWSLSAPYAASNKTILNHEYEQLHILGFTGGHSSGSQLICNRASNKPAEGAAARAFGMSTTSLSVAFVLALAILHM